VRRARFMMNNQGEKEGFKSFGNVFATIVRTEGKDLKFSIFLEESLKNFEAGKNF
jgi:hypothetical protein